MKMTKKQIEAHCFYIVEAGFQVLPPTSATEYLTVGMEEAVKVNDYLYCTQEWHDALFSKINS